MHVEAVARDLKGGAAVVVCSPVALHIVKVDGVDLLAAARPQLARIQRHQLVHAGLNKLDEVVLKQGVPGVGLWAEAVLQVAEAELHDVEMLQNQSQVRRKADEVLFHGARLCPPAALTALLHTRDGHLDLRPEELEEAAVWARAVLGGRRQNELRLHCHVQAVRASRGSGLQAAKALLDGGRSPASDFLQGPPPAKHGPNLLRGRCPAGAVLAALVATQQADAARLGSPAGLWKRALRH
mmetsp:Transcript_32192/g.91332  ORF Transcript_32192/g.91332 Transcript_32192/m.91332 type:complete len:240 (-) Transcript_32192:196-915(-)